jgi:hypothetical protein
MVALRASILLKQTSWDGDPGFGDLGVSRS